MISLVCYQKSKKQHLIINRKLEVATFSKFVYTCLNSTVCKRTATHLKHGLTSCGAGVWSPENEGPIKWTFGLCFFFYFLTITDIFSGNTGHVKYIYSWKSLASHLLKSTYQFCLSYIITITCITEHDIPTNAPVYAINKFIFWL